MKRLLLGIGWFVLLWLGGMMVGGAVAGAIATSANPDPSRAVQTGTDAGARFAVQYGGLVQLGAIAVAAIGTLTGLLPGTKKD